MSAAAAGIAQAFGASINAGSKIPRNIHPHWSSVAWQITCSREVGATHAHQGSNGTPSGGESTLCATCRCSTIVRGRTLDEELVVCSALGLRGVQITFKVTFCSDYADMRQPSYME